MKRCGLGNVFGFFGILVVLSQVTGTLAVLGLYYRSIRPNTYCRLKEMIMHTALVLAKGGSEEVLTD